MGAREPTIDARHTRLAHRVNGRPGKQPLLNQRLRSPATGTDLNVHGGLGNRAPTTSRYVAVRRCSVAAATDVAKAIALDVEVSELE